MIAVVHYGAGNLRSVCNALDAIGAEYRLASRPEHLAATKILLPGVGHFGAMMKSLEGTGMAGALRDAAAEGAPLFGICLGMQALFESSEEAPGVQGLGLISGRVVRFPESVKVPHMGWNTVEGGGEEESFYFANSFYAPFSEHTVGKTRYGLEFSASVRFGNVEGVQFHPEKSGRAGLSLLQKWCERC
jgi:imidazole glycerol phosphate synthase glutamine amidotransferase subunit